MKKVAKKKIVNIWTNAKAFIGLKQIKAVAMARGTYNKLRGWEVPADENPKDAGYVVQYPDGYISWSPKEQFETHYKTGSNHDFSMALYLLKQGHKVARKGWNGKKMWLMLVPGSSAIKVVKGTPYAKAGLTNGLDINAHIDMFTAQGTMQPGWVASQTDMLANDWGTVD